MLAGLCDDKKVARIGALVQVHTTKIGEWKNQSVSRATEMSGGERVAEPVGFDTLQIDIAQFALAID